MKNIRIDNNKVANVSRLQSRSAMSVSLSAVCESRGLNPTRKTLPKLYSFSVHLAQANEAMKKLVQAIPKTIVLSPGVEPHSKL